MLAPKTWYMPHVTNFESVDALVSPDIFVHFFTSKRGSHGYKVHGLMTLHAQLRLPSMDC
jgi:hypothetical protein